MIRLRVPMWIAIARALVGVIVSVSRDLVHFYDGLGPSGHGSR
jgi:hypothetical protein